MELCLHYYGKLKSQDNSAGKHRIRQQLHAQVQSICKSEQFANMFDADIKGTRSSAEQQMYVDFSGKRYWYLIAAHLATVVDLKITLLLPHDERRIVQNGGDIDNRIKTLFDALRTPSVASEIPTNDDFNYAENGMFCLLQDDRLINRISVQTYRDHAPSEPDYVRCIIEVETRITRALWGNLGFG